MSPAVDRARAAWPTAAPWLLAGLLTAAGVTHFVAPTPYERIVPRVLGHARLFVELSGVAELACAGLVAVPRTRRLGGLASAVLFVAVFPANVQMALDGGVPGGTGLAASPVVAWARLPLQVPLVVGALGVARRSRVGTR